MKARASLVAALLLAVVSVAAAADETAPPAKPRTTAEILAASATEDWRRPDPKNLMYLELASGRVIIELAPRFAPVHLANIRKLIAQQYFNGLAITRVQDNFVAQWGQPLEKHKSFGDMNLNPPAEYTVADSAELPFVALKDQDGYASETGWVDGLPAARDAKTKLSWLTHCYGTLGVGRDNPPDTGVGNELYVVIGQPPRQLDRNITVVGRVLKGMELLASLPRGSGAAGFYEKPEQHVPIRAIRLASDVPVTERTPLEVLRTDTPLFAQYVESRRNRRDDWYVQPAGHIDVCNVAIPIR